ncbi:hypothetical protein MRX96_052275 [Rhipicephalus microplus]
MTEKCGCRKLPLKPRPHLSKKNLADCCCREPTQKNHSPPLPPPILEFSTSTVDEEEYPGLLSGPTNGPGSQILEGACQVVRSHTVRKPVQIWAGQPGH